LIDDMSGTSAEHIPFVPPSCAANGSWYLAVGGTPAGMIAPSTSSPFTYSTLPGGPPTQLPNATAGACVSGVTSPEQFNGTDSMFVNLAGAGGVPALIDASGYSGIEFYLWQDSTAVVPSGELYLLVDDKAETSGYGVCDGTYTGPTGCVGPVATIPAQAGWQKVTLPWSGFASLPNTGSDNETALDPTTLTSLDFQVQQDAAGVTSGVPFHFCVLDLQFY
jgi:hypothetical protein